MKFWIHKASVGGIADHECIETAFDAQLSMEQAMLDRTEYTQINTDYEKFFDTFDPKFIPQILNSHRAPKSGGGPHIGHVYINTKAHQNWKTCRQGFQQQQRLWAR